jgi:hypothetical protein
MPRKSKTDRELGWLRNVWEELAAVELKHGAFARVEMRPTASRSSFVVRVVAERPDTESGYPGWTYATAARYPNGDNTEFLAWLWGRCDRFADEAALSDVAVSAHGKEKD